MSTTNELPPGRCQIVGRVALFWVNRDGRRVSAHDEHVAQAEYDAMRYGHGWQLDVERASRR